MLFPENPTNGTLFRQPNGVYYQYDAALNAWMRLTSDDLDMRLVSSTSDGAMKAEDLKKLNRLLYNPPISSITGDNCVAPYRSGVIELKSGDDFINVEGNISVQNIDEFGDHISQQVPFQIHQKTYGFDFNLDTQSLITELQNRNQIRLSGKKGEKGDRGEPGESGISNVLSGPPGPDGRPGLTPASPFVVETETIAAQPVMGLKKVLTDVKVVPDPVYQKRYTLQFTRKFIGNANLVSSQLIPRAQKSSWLLAVGNLSEEEISATTVCGFPGDPSTFYNLLYFDVSPILDKIHDKYLSEIDRLKKGYEDIVAFWIQTMSDLFDEQKAALCCALEHCLSVSKSTQLRQHIESVAGAAAGKARVTLHGRNSDEAALVPSRKLLNDARERNDVYSEIPLACDDGDVVFPVSNDSGNRTGGGSGAGATGPTGQIGSAGLAGIVVSQTAPSLTNILWADTSTTGNGMFSGASGSSGATGFNDIQTLKQSFAKEAITVSVDPLFNCNNNNAQRIQLPRGRYTAVVIEGSAMINGEYRSNIKIGFVEGNDRPFVSILNKGSFKDPMSARAAYEGLSVSFEHDGGEVRVFLPSVMPKTYSGRVLVRLEPQNKAFNYTSKTAVPKADCFMTSEQLVAYESKWKQRACCGFVTEIAGQKYIIMKVSVGDDVNCGGGESINNDCIVTYAHIAHPAIAMPTFDGESFINIMEGRTKLFIDSSFTTIVWNKINQGQVVNSMGPINPSEYSVILIASA